MTDWLTGPAGTNLPVLAGMALTAVLCWRLLARPSVAGPRDGAGTTPSLARTAAPFVVAQVLVAAGFWLSRSTDSIWILVVLAAILGVSAASVAVLGRAARRAGSTVTGPVIAVLALTALLNELGALLLVRLVIVSDPDDPFGAGLTGRAWREARDAVGFPLLVAGAALAVAWLFTSTGTGHGLVAQARRALDRWLARRRPQRAARGDRPGASGRTIALGALSALVLFVLPVAGPTTGTAHLTFLGVATPEFGLVVLLAVLAALAARYGHRFTTTSRVDALGLLRRLRRGQASRGDLRVMWVDLRHMLLPVGLFVLVAATCAVRSDFGTVVPALAATFGVTWAATTDAVRRSPDLVEDGSFSPATVWRRLVRSLRVYRVFIVAGVTLVLTAGVVVFLGTGYVQERASVWADPWAYRWDAGCVVPAGARPSPTGELFCQQSLSANVESEHSQVARALAAVADGGVWGRGLRDTASGMVPAGQTDFVLAVVWNKLGGLAVLLTSALVILLGAALRQVGLRGRPGGPARPGRRQGQLWFAFFAAGLASMIVGNYLFVFLATVNVIPHSGIPAPFLSRGGQWTLALLAGIACVVLLASRGEPAASPVERPAPATPAGRLVRPGRLAVLAPLVLCLWCAAWITMVPYQRPGLPIPAAYDQARPACPVRADTRDALTSPAPDPAACSTDRLAFDRTRVEVRLAGRPVLEQDRATGAWRLIGTPAGRLSLADLSGLVKVGGGGVGLLDQSYDDITQETAGTTLAKRLRPPSTTPEADGVLDLTIDPAIQHQVAQALRADGSADAPPMAGGVVAIEATTGHILASATAPAFPDPPGAGSHATPDAGSTSAADRFLDDHPYYGPLAGEGLDGSSEDATCRAAAAHGEARADCWKWSVIEPAADRDDATAALLRYVGGDRTADLPTPDVNRAVGKWYGFGSTFKVVIAATYLSQGGQPDDLLDAPVTVQLAPEVVIHNAGGGACRGGEDGRISLTRALAVSCNTAFVNLAIQLGWPAIAEQARKFGMTVGSCDGKPAWLAHRGEGAVASCVPADVDGVSIGNDALGGQDVQGTPLAMATVLAAVANHGSAVQPTLVRSVRHPGSGAVEHPVAKSSPALDPRVADALTRALSETAIDGTAKDLNTAVKTTLWVKTGTHEVVPAGTTPPPGQYVIVDSWLVGFVNTATHGPVAFAAVVEAHDEKAGAARTRLLVQQLCAALGVTP